MIRFEDFTNHHIKREKVLLGMIDLAITSMVENDLCNSIYSANLVQAERNIKYRRTKVKKSSNFLYRVGRRFGFSLTLH